MSSDVLEVQRVLAALVPKISECSQHLDAQHVANSLYGMQNMSNDVLEVHQVLAALVPKIARCSQQLGAQAVAMSIVGILGNGCSPGCRERECLFVQCY